jgi:hypothetical protein
MLSRLIKEYFSCSTCCFKPDRPLDECDNPKASRSNEGFELDEYDKTDDKKQQRLGNQKINLSMQSLESRASSNYVIPLLRLTLLGDGGVG